MATYIFTDCSLSSEGSSKSRTLHFWTLQTGCYRCCRRYCHPASHLHTRKHLPTLYAFLLLTGYLGRWHQSAALVSVLRSGFWACHLGQRYCEGIGFHPELCFAGAFLPDDAPKICYSYTWQHVIPCHQFQGSNILICSGSWTRKYFYTAFEICLTFTKLSMGGQNICKCTWDYLSNIISSGSISCTRRPLGVIPRKRQLFESRMKTCWLPVVRQTWRRRTVQFARSLLPQPQILSDSRW